jgi:hypothetical protein
VFLALLRRLDTLTLAYIGRHAAHIGWPRGLTLPVPDLPARLAGLPLRAPQHWRGHGPRPSDSDGQDWYFEPEKTLTAQQLISMLMADCRSRLRSRLGWKRMQLAPLARLNLSTTPCSDPPARPIQVVSLRHREASTSTCTDATEAGPHVNRTVEDSCYADLRTRNRAD